ncbi:hypothetical protein BZG36_04424 [Bifiguratus adelaidae]|uniref:Uncharacterized protein n=1 Tax=Bifiguratus adelaidae TaxID=1938954 RepID=A0A261XWP3_9FUNG|nr:hypothetical protein BZG36_04424 [Bifiguratus adelaidae]
MSLVHRDENCIVIDSGSYLIKAGLGVHDTNKPPSVFLETKQFDSPVIGDEVKDWDKFETMYNHLLFKLLPIKKSRNESPVLISVPPTMSKTAREKLTQIFFESFNAPGLYVAEQPLLSLYGCGVVTGLVIDIGHEFTYVTPIVDSGVQYHLCETIPIAGRHFTQYLLSLLKTDTTLISQLAEAGLECDAELAQFIKEQPDLCDVSVGHHKRPNEDITSLADVVPVTEDSENKPVEELLPERAEIEYKGVKLSIGPYRHRVYDPLFEPELVSMNTPSLPELLTHIQRFCEPPEIRPKLWEAIVLTGGSACIAGLSARMEYALKPYLTISDSASETQVHDQMRYLKIPDYFSVLKETRAQSVRWATWLGGEIVAKLVFAANNYITKADYNEHGPSVVHTKSY